MVTSKIDVTPASFHVPPQLPATPAVSTAVVVVGLELLELPPHPTTPIVRATIATTMNPTFHRCLAFIASSLGLSVTR